MLILPPSMRLGAASCLYQVLGQSGDVMLLPSTDPLRTGHGEKVKGREGTLVLGCINTLELLGVVGHILPMWLGHSFLSTASAQALSAAE